METESKDIIEKQKLEVFGILKEALTVPYRNINFIMFTIITSLPLLCFLIYFESFLLRIIIETSGILVPSPHFNYAWPAPDEVMPENLNKDFAYKLIQLSLLYLIPLHLLELFNMLLTIDLASKIYKEEHSMSLKEMVDKLMHMRKLRGTFFSSQHAFSSIASRGFQRKKLMRRSGLLLQQLIKESYLQKRWNLNNYIRLQLSKKCL